MIKRVCQRCGETFLTFPSRIKVGWGKYCSIQCINGPPKQKMRCQQCGKEFEVSYCRTLSDRKKFCSKECNFESQRVGKVERICEFCEGKFVVRPLVAEKGGGRYCSRQCAGKAKRGRRFSILHRKRISEAFKHLWQQPDYIRMELAALKVKPTKPELQLQAILDNHFPQFKYNGDFSLGITLGGLIPDFVNVNSRKELIEIFGEYWHTRKDIRWNYTELGRMMAFGSIGFKCLIIWASELTDEQAVINKIKGFIKERRR